MPPNANDPDLKEDEVVQARILVGFPQLVRELGGDPTPYLRRVGIELETISLPSAVTSYRRVIAAFEEAAEDLSCADFGMRLATIQQSIRLYSPLGQVVRNARTLGEAIDYVSRNIHAHTLAARVWIKRVRGGPTFFVGHDFLLRGLPIGSQAMEHMLLQRHLDTLELTNNCARVRRVFFRHQGLSPANVYRRYFGCEVRFEQIVDGVELLQRDLECPIVNRDVEAYQAAASLVDGATSRREPHVQSLVRGVVLQLLGTENCKRDLVAAELNLPPHTLHRQLKAEGTSFQRIKDDVRRDLMLYYIQHTALDFSEISERLGFSEQSAMTHSCNRWFATSPTGLRAPQDH